MKKIKFEYEEKQRALEVDGVEYVIPSRTAQLEEKIRKHDKNLADMTEYEGNMEMLEILFGKANAEKMFPDKKNTNLDKLTKCVKCAVALFMADFYEIQTANIVSLINPDKK